MCAKTLAAHKLACSCFVTLLWSSVDVLPKPMNTFAIHLTNFVNLKSLSISQLFFYPKSISQYVFLSFVTDVTSPVIVVSLAPWTTVGVRIGAGMFFVCFPCSHDASLH